MSNGEISWNYYLFKKIPVKITTAHKRNISGYKLTLRRIE